MATVGAGLDDSRSHSQLRVAAGAEQVSGVTTFRVLRRNLPELNVRIARLARRAERLGTAPLALRDIGGADRKHALVVLEGEAPALAGWTLAAIVDHRDGEPRLRVTSSAAPALDPGRFRETRCDHCRLRRRRVETYVVWHAGTQRLRQVGTGCLRDFLGGHDPERLCRQAEYVLLARESIATAAGPRLVPVGVIEGVALDELAAHAAMVLRADGWVSRERARETGWQASADAALHSLQSMPGAPRPVDLDVATCALQWARELLAAKPTLSDFERDASLVAGADRLRTARERGLACALIAVYRRRRAASQHLGRPGEWLETVVVVERVVDRPSRRHGSVRRHDLIDVHCNRLVWWQTSGAPLPHGRAVRIHGRVERHTRFGHAPVTVLAYCHTLP